MPSVEDRKQYAGGVEQAQSFRSPTPTPRPTRLANRIPAERRWQPGEHRAHAAPTHLSDLFSELRAVMVATLRDGQVLSAKNRDRLAAAIKHIEDIIAEHEASEAEHD